MTGTAPDEILEFWFERAGPKAWFAVDPAFDARVRRLFAPLVFALERERDVADHPWMGGPEGALALILALDQFPRNIWRGTPKAFALDAKGLSAARIAVEAGYDWVFEPDRRAFVYMPFMHSERMEDQDACVALCEARLGEDSGTARHARAHRELIARFGRFPHRNAILGRVSTPEEAAFLEDGGYAPGAKRPAKSS